MFARRLLSDLPQSSDFQLERLESRVMFSADAVLAGLPMVGPPVEQVTIVQPSAEVVAQEQAALVDGANAGASKVGNELVVIDAAVPDLQSLLADLAGHADAPRVIVLEAGADPLARLARLLEAERGLTALHLVSHGADGQLLLGGERLATVDLLAAAPDVMAWRTAFAEGADLLVYGCDVAAGADGRAFTDTLARLSGADVAASSDLTGGARVGGDWTLEYRRGDVQHDVAFSQALHEGFSESLVIHQVTTLADSGAGSLREAIIASNASATTDAIEFNTPPGTIALATGLPRIIDTVTIDATTVPGYVDTPLIVIDGGALSNSEDGLEFWPSGGSSVVRGLMIVGFPGNGIEVYQTQRIVIGGAGVGNVISGNGLAGIHLHGSATVDAVISGNRIGTDLSGTSALGNGLNGVYISDQAKRNTIGGNALLGEGNLVSGNASGFSGIAVNGTGTRDNEIIGNLIGTDASGTAPLGNANAGVWLGAGSSGTVVGGDTLADRNVISGNAQTGVDLSNTSGNTIAGNAIGTDAGGTIAIANANYGVLFRNGASDNLVGGTSAGAGNTIRSNTDAGVAVLGSGSTGNALLQNSIDGNGGLAIELGAVGVLSNDSADADAGANDHQNYPVLAQVLTDEAGTVRIEGTLDSTANTDFRIDVYASDSADASGHGEAQRHVGTATVTTASSGPLAFVLTLVDSLPIDQVVSATATSLDAGGAPQSTSELSANVISAYLAEAADDSYSVGAQDVLTMAAPGMLSNDPDRSAGPPPGNAVTAIDDSATSGTVTYASDGSFTYDPNGQFEALGVGQTATDTFTYTSDDGNGTTATPTVSIEVSGVNEAPVLDIDSTPAFTSITEDEVDNPGQTIASLLASGGDPITDVDGDPEGIAAVSLNNSDNRFEYSLDGGGSWAPLAAPSGNSLQLLRDTDLIRFVPDGIDSQSAAIAFRAWDGTSGSAGDLIDSGSAYGGSTSLSAGFDLAFMSTTAINDAPVFTSDGGGAVGARSVEENQIGATTATRADVDGGTPAYSIGGGPDAAAFAIDAGTGVMTFLAAPDFETPHDADVDGTYVVDLVVDDGQGGTAVQRLSVAVVDLPEATDDAYATDEDTVLTIDAPGLLGNDGGEPGLEGSPVLGFDASVDTDGDAVWTSNVGSSGLTLEAGVTHVSPPDNAPPGIAAAFDFDGTGGATGPSLSSLPQIDPARDASIELWLRPDDLVGGQVLFETGDVGSGGIVLKLEGSFLQISVEDGGDFYQSGQSASDMQAGEWHHLVMTIEMSAAPVISIYVDGALKRQDTVPGSNFTRWADGGFGLGTVNASAPMNQSAADFAGQMSDLRIHDEAMDVAAITANRDAPGAAASPAVVASLDSSATSGTVSPGASGEFVYDPNGQFDTLSAGESATDTFAYTIDDGAGTLTSATVSIVVSGVNDAPAITSGATADVIENRTSVMAITSSDVDAGAPVYSIAGGVDAALFDIDAVSGELGFLAAPDFESPADTGADNVYDVVVEVSDGAGESDSRPVAVTLEDENDNAPLITSDGGGPTALLNVTENQIAVTTVTASDADTGPVLSYSLGGGADQAAFTIDAATGALRFASAPDRETQASYEVEVSVSDGVASDSQTLTVTIDDLNDNAPLITSDGGGPTASLNVAENQITVTTVTASDADTGPAPTYSLSGGADQAAFTIDAATGALRFASAPDRETQASYEVEVSVSDGVASDSQTLTVTVDDLNDTAPVITSGGGGEAASVSVDENRTAVTTVAAIDPDAGPALQYSLSGGADRAAFTIDSATGALSFANPPDREVQDAYEVEVTVSDGLASDTQALAVTIADLNDSAPVITSDGGGAAATVLVEENRTAVTTVSAIDPDVDPALSYSLSGGADRADFVVDESSGALVFLVAPDRETRERYEVEVTVSDGVSTDSQMLTVALGDENDNAPVITSDGGGPSASVVVEQSAIAVTTVNAVDEDTGPPLQYSLNGGADREAFSIEGSTGVLTFVDSPGRGGQARYEVEVAVSDGVAKDTQALTVMVSIEGVNDVAPVITSDGGGATAAIRVAENERAVTSVTSRDEDAADSAVYSLLGGADRAHFSIDPASGVLVFIDAPDFEAPTDENADGVHEVTVQVSDEGGSIDTQAIDVTIGNVDELPSAVADSLAAREDVVLLIDPSTQLLGNDSDPDAGALQLVSFTQPEHGTLVSTPQGKLRYSPEPDYNGGDAFEYVIADATGNRASAQATLTVAAVNDAPVLKPAESGAPTKPGVIDASRVAAGLIPVSENSGTVGLVEARDVDGDTLGFSLDGPDAGLFVIDPATGQLSAIAPLDFEAPQDTDADNDYELELVIVDSQGEQTRIPIRLSVADVNEAPTLIRTSFTTVEGYSGTLGRLAAVDPDSGDTLEFAIASDGDTSVPDGLVLSSDGTLDVSGLAPGAYELDVLVKDRSGLVSTGRITVTVESLDDGEPALGAANAGESGSPTVPSAGGRVDVTVSYAAVLPVPAGTTTSPTGAYLTGTERSAPDVMLMGKRAAAQIQMPTVPTSASGMATHFIESRQSANVETRLSDSLVLTDVPLTPEQLFDLVEQIRSSIESLDDQEEATENRKMLVIGFGGVVLGIGATGWLLTSRLLLAAALSTLSLWRPLDPIPVLLERRGAADEDPEHPDPGETRA